MIRLLHISDLHFGRDRPELVAPLVSAINGAGADLVVVSGDLTQRARRHQFRAARDFLDRLAPPWLSVPGNHDIPLHDPVRRLLHPFHAYRRWIGEDLEPERDLGAVRVVGLNTATPYAWQRGWARGRAVARACRRLGGGGARFNVIVAHHPFTPDAGARKAPMRGAARAGAALSGCGAHLVLSGHLHRWRAAPFVTRADGAQILEVHAGTGISTRLREEPNDFAILDFAGTEVRITRMVADLTGPAEGIAFAPASTAGFRRADGRWTVA